VISDENETPRTTRVEMTLIVVISLAMVILPVIEIVLRSGGDLRDFVEHHKSPVLLWLVAHLIPNTRTFPGGSVYVQHFTLWLGFIGALGATAAGKHLGLASGNLLPAGKPRLYAGIFGAMVSTSVCLVLAWASTGVVIASRSGTATLAGGIPEWWSEVIVPVTLVLIAARFLWLAPGGWRGRIACTVAALFTIAVFLGLGDRAHFLFWPLFVCVVVAFLLGAPVFVGMSGAAMLLFFHESTPIAAVPTETLRLVENPTLPAIPLLTLAGYILASGKASERLVRAYKSLFGWLPGGLALMAISVCALFTTFTGGSGVTILALGGLVLPALLKDQYPEGFSHGLVTASGSLGLLFPPSLPVILYGAVAGVAADKLFLGGLVPGVILILVVAAYAVRAGIVARAPRQAFSSREVGHALWAAKWDLGLPVVVLAVFVSGLATIVEAAALGALYAIVVELTVFRDVEPMKQMPAVFVQSSTLVGAVVILLGVALGLTSYLVDAQIPDALIEFVQKHFHSQWTFLLALNGLLLVLGSVFEIYAAIIVLAPLIAPLGALFNVDPVHLGVVFLANLELGFLFPPMGLNLFLSASRFGKPLPYLYKQALPFLVIMALGVLFITYVPAVTTGVLALIHR
jgi:tripartite ATP-independent transporter DctM subunit